MDDMHGYSASSTCLSILFQKRDYITRARALDLKL